MAEPNATTPRAHATGARTREQLIVTAERLFADRSIESVSFREIGTAANQRNTRVTQYHFGDRDGLIRAIFEYRLPSIDARRRALLDELERGGRTGDLNALVEALVLPLIEDAQADSRYVAFLARLPRLGLHEHDGPYLKTDAQLTKASLHLGELIRAAIPHVPEALRLDRYRLVTTLMVNRIATMQSDQEIGADTLPVDVVIGDLVDALVAVLAAECSTTTLAALGIRNGRSGSTR